MIQQGVDVDHQNYYGDTALHLCVSFRLIRPIKVLLSHHAKCLKNKQGLTPLHLAAQLGYTELISLLASPDTIDLTNLEGETALFLVTTRKDALVLLSAGANPNARCLMYNTPLLHHTQKSLQGPASALIEFGFKKKTVKLDTVDFKKRSFLHIAAHLNLISLLQLYVNLTKENGEFKFLLNLQTSKKNTCLHSAIFAQHEEATKLLLKAGIDPWIKNIQGLTAFELCQEPTLRQFCEDHALFYQVARGAPVARLFRYSHHEEDIRFFIKSSVMGQDIIAVERTLSEFGRLRTQLLVEHPESCL